MLNFSPNLSTLYHEVPFLQRFSKARAAGFRYVEFQFPYEFQIDEIKREVQTHNLNVVLFNLPPGDWKQGDRGIAILPDRRQEFREAVEEAIRYATALNCPRLHCLAGILPEEMPAVDAWKVFAENLRHAASKFADYGLTLLIEPINTFDMPGYFLSDLRRAYSMICELKLPNLKIQYDFYHIQRIQGELLTSYKRLQDLIGHVQIADTPGRHQPGTGEINYSNIFRFLEDSGYQGYVGLEYIPAGPSDESFNWLPAGFRKM